MTEAGDPALIGRRVANKFVVEKFLGGGAMGAVYRARDASLERKVALKVMHPSLAIDPSFVKRFHREARAASRLEHPNSVHVIEFGEEADGHLYIAMEYLEGRDLYRVIHEDWPLSEARLAQVMMQALGAAAVAHEMGVIHRDLKPENIMILDRKDDEGNDIVKVCDFGIAKITESDEEEQASRKLPGAKLTTAGLVVGTPEYMSPEQARGEKLDARSDLYSLGVILYQLLTGRTPFVADTALAVVLKHISEVPEPPSTIYPGVHKGLEAVCMRALAKSRDDRFQSARAMRVAVKAAIEGRPMPIDIAAETAAAPPSTLAETRTSGSVAATSAGASKVTPLGTVQAAPAETRSRVPLLIGVALLASAIGAAGVVAYTKKGIGKDASPVPAGSSTPAPTSPPNVVLSGSAPTGTVAPPPVPEEKAPVAPSAAPGPDSKRAAPPSPRSQVGERDSKNALVEAPAPPEPVATSSPAPVPPPPVAPAPPVVVAPAPVAPAPFSPATCRAVLAPPASRTSYNVRDLTLRGTDAAWTACAKTAIHQRPAGPIAATVRLQFNDNRNFKSATCTGCPAPLDACIRSSTGRTVAVTFHSGDALGDPVFDVPVTFTCD